MAPAPAPGTRNIAPAGRVSLLESAEKAGERTISESTTSSGSAVGTMHVSHSMRPFKTLCP